MELLSEYGLFLAKIVTVVLAIAAIAAIIVNVAQRNKRQRGELRVNNLSEQYKEMKEELAAALMDSHQDVYKRQHPVAHHKNVACSAEPHSENWPAVAAVCGFLPKSPCLRRFSLKRFASFTLVPPAR